MAITYAQALANYRSAKTPIARRQAKIALDAIQKPAATGTAPKPQSGGIPKPAVGTAPDAGTVGMGSMGQSVDTMAPAAPNPNDVGMAGREGIYDQQLAGNLPFAPAQNGVAPIPGTLPNDFKYSPPSNDPRQQIIDYLNQNPGAAGTATTDTNPAVNQPPVDPSLDGSSGIATPPPAPSLDTMPYDQEYQSLMDQIRQRIAAGDSTFAEYLTRLQGDAYGQKRSLADQLPGLTGNIKNNYAGRGLLYSGGFADDYGSTVQNYANAGSAIDQDLQAKQNDLARQQAALHTTGIDQEANARQTYASNLANKAGELGISHLKSPILGDVDVNGLPKTAPGVDLSKLGVGAAPALKSVQPVAAATAGPTGAYSSGPGAANAPVSQAGSVVNSAPGTGQDDLLAAILRKLKGGV